MLYVWRSELRKHKNESASALMHPREVWAGKEPIFSLGEPIVYKHKKRYDFIIDPKWILTDDQSTLTANIPLFSGRLINLLEKFGVRLEKISARILSARDYQVLSENYWIANILDKSQGTRESDIESLSTSKPLYRLEPRTDILVVRNDLLSEMQTVGITGIWVAHWTEFQIQRMPVGRVLNPISQTAAIWKRKKS